MLYFDHLKDANLLCKDYLNQSSWVNWFDHRFKAAHGSKNFLMICANFAIFTKHFGFLHNQLPSKDMNQQWFAGKAMEN